MSMPAQRAEGIEVVSAADGYVVYDPRRDRVHYLNHTAALVLEFATGENSDAEITRKLQVAYDLPVRRHGRCRSVSSSSATRGWSHESAPAVGCADRAR